MADYLSIPFPRQLYHDLVRWSDGRFDPAEQAVTLLLWHLERCVMFDDDWGYLEEHFGDNADTLARTLFPQHTLENRNLPSAAPLIWKGVNIPENTEVRMDYGGRPHTAAIRCAKIEDGDGRYSPSEWASKVAGGTARNAWRDLWFKRPGSSEWVNAMSLREALRSKESES